jgi:hypothetical protein
MDLKHVVKVAQQIPNTSSLYTIPLKTGGCRRFFLILELFSFMRGYTTKFLRAP